MSARGAAPERLTAFGPGKVILLGEHAVVYGGAALAAPLCLGITAHGEPAARAQLELPSALRPSARRALRRAFLEAARQVKGPPLRVRLEGDLPVSMGLGSSAAVSVACARLLLSAAGRAPTVDAVCQIAERMEQVFHGSPSGIDHTVSARNRALLFRRVPGKPAKIRELRAAAPLHLVVSLVGERASTAATVAALATRRGRWPGRYARLIAEVGALAEEGARAIASGDRESLGDLMNVNHGLLGALGLSSPRIDAAVHALRQAGALGAKLTGAGGDGGAVIGLFHPAQAPRIAAQLRRQGTPSFATRVFAPREP